jgi:transcriptional regulator with XRE-family HTH domain
MQVTKGDLEMADFARLLKEAREAAGLTQDALAEKVGIHRVQIARLEGGTSKPTWETVQKIAAALHVSCEAFQGSVSTPTARNTGSKGTRSR